MPKSVSELQYKQISREVHQAMALNNICDEREINYIIFHNMITTTEIKK
jgi:hypothetical protein